MKKNLIEYLEIRYMDVNDQMYSMEMSDERLFTNKNGNLPRYRELQGESKQLSQYIKYLKDECTCSQ